MSVQQMTDTAISWRQHGGELWIFQDSAIIAKISGGALDALNVSVALAIQEARR